MTSVFNIFLKLNLRYLKRFKCKLFLTAFICFCFYHFFFNLTHFASTFPSFQLHKVSDMYTLVDSIKNDVKVQYIFKIYRQNLNMAVQRNFSKAGRGVNFLMVNSVTCMNVLKLGTEQLEKLLKKIKVN